MRDLPGGERDLTGVRRTGRKDERDLTGVRGIYVGERSLKGMKKSRGEGDLTERD